MIFSLATKIGEKVGPGDAGSDFFWYCTRTGDGWAGKKPQSSALRCKRRWVAEPDRRAEQAPPLQVCGKYEAARGGWLGLEIAEMGQAEWGA